MYYISTRDTASFPSQYTAAQAICSGLAPDGGLFVPASIPQITQNELKSLCSASYDRRAAEILSLYLTDFSLEELQNLCKQAYCAESFPNGAAPVSILDEKNYMLELWH